MQTELTWIGRELLKQLDQIVSDEMDISMGTGELLESVSLSDNIVISSYFFNLFQNLYTLPEVINQPVSVTEPADHENLINPSSERVHNHSPGKFPGPGHDNEPVDRIEVNDSNTGSDLNRPGAEDNKGPLQVSAWYNSIDAIPKRNAEYFDDLTIAPVTDNLKTVNNTTGIGSFSDLANEFLPAETISKAKQYANDTFSQPKAENSRGKVLLENETTKINLAEQPTIKDRHDGHLSEAENDSIKPETVPGDVIIIQKSLQDKSDKLESPDSNLVSFPSEKNMQADHLIKTTNLSSILEKAIQEGTREEILEMAKVFAELIKKETTDRDSDEFHNNTDKAEPQLYFERHHAPSKANLFPGVTETKFFEEYHQDYPSFNGYIEPIVSWIKSTKSEAKPDNPAYNELKNLRLNYRRYYGV